MTFEDEIVRGIEIDCGLPIRIAQAVADKKKIAYQRGRDDYKQRVKEVLNKYSSGAYYSGREGQFVNDIKATKKTIFKELGLED